MSHLDFGYKRYFDCTLLCLLGILLAPFWVMFMIGVVVAIFLEDGGNVFYLQQRIGLDGHRFNIIKFRTMTIDTEREIFMTSAVSSELGAVEDTVRITRVGKFLRHLHLDELPQVVNIFRGDMSLVGPRPENPKITTKIQESLPSFRDRLKVPPGIAGLAQLRGGHGIAARNKLRYDKLYISKMSPLVDMKLVALCIAKSVLPNSYRFERKGHVRTTSII